MSTFILSVDSLPIFNRDTVHRETKEPKCGRLNVSNLSLVSKWLNHKVNCDWNKDMLLWCWLSGNSARLLQIQMLVQPPPFPSSGAETLHAHYVFYDYFEMWCFHMWKCVSYWGWHSSCPPGKRIGNRPTLTTVTVAPPTVCKSLPVQTIYLFMIPQRASLHTIMKGKGRKNPNRCLTTAGPPPKLKTCIKSPWPQCPAQNRSYHRGG